MTVEQFERWWAIYPRRESKLKARDSYKTARLRGATIEELESGARRYRDDPNRDPAFTKIPTTWLNQGCWDDEPLPPREEAPKPTTPAAPPRRKFT